MGAKEDYPSLITRKKDMKMICILHINKLSNFLCYGWILCVLTCQMGCSKKDPSPVARLVATLKTGDYQSRIDAFIELINLGADAKPAIPTLKKLLEEDPDQHIRTTAAETLGAIGPDAKTAIPTLVIRLKDDKEPNVRCACAEALAKIGDKEDRVIFALRNALADTDSNVRMEVAESLSALDPNNEDSIPVLTRLLKDKDPHTRSSAANSLGIIFQSTRIKSAIPALVRSLEDSEAEVRESVARSLGYICEEPETVVPALIKRVNEEKDPLVRISAIKALGEYGPEAKASIPDLTQALKDLDRDVQVAAGQSLDHIKTWKKKRGRKGMQEIKGKEEKEEREEKGVGTRSHGGALTWLESLGRIYESRPLFLLYSYYFERCLIATSPCGRAMRVMQSTNRRDNR